MAAQSKPPLPPRTPSTASNGHAGYLSPLISPNSNSSVYLGGLDDPRASSTQSLQPVKSVGDKRRTLLVVYIHGFLGTETSFKSFPAHVHSLLTPAVAGTHVVYTKIYPRYKSRRNISFARDDFSNWLTPRESTTTDVILVGHSLGGILAAEVVLIPSQSPRENNSLFQHRILGLMTFDTPFLGMHPGVVGTGIASLFRAPPQLPDPQPLQSSPFSDASSTLQDPTYNPTYSNDVLLANRKGKLQRAWYFWNKHCGELAKAAGDYVSSHLEFGGCLADYPGLKRRYSAIRALEDVDETVESRTPEGKLMKRVRFVNYYSASSGPIRERSPSPNKQQASLEPPTTEFQDTSTRRSSGESLHPSTLSSPRLSLEEHRDGEVVAKDVAELKINPDPPACTPVSSTSEHTSISGSLSESLHVAEAVSTELGLPPLPALPERPPEFDASQYQDEDTLKLVRKEHKRQIQAYERAVKDWNKSVKDREKLLQKRQRKQQEQASKIATEQESRQQKEQLETSSTLNPEEYERQLRQEAEVSGATPQNGKAQKDRKFCALPAKDPNTGKQDPTWVRIYMGGIDEVTAHTSMFNESETYTKLVRDVAERIETWVAEDASLRTVLAGMEP
ncbi:uncharacterized protein Z520_09051 [Fonsecaea multimorphosa CBS 102226]|uniref:AB hydrolase-1 domain-containing protein n=1 Tax=Fonsecaea multimorphosa CBS 102226 TaxID=1442371 RepID=A0A0D2GZY8_9EURO|nr:uncharacterized protein Z520_09051 [Fonsecaea multimorphosa CBS 102226]KIX95135.1 hypothetical protein Z520_09051 [Fonsecaea multimorphosa CBS 102226]OAL20856.1 hypothetical protein AYO22_08484 [Fonsecaea multimorphosa]